MEHIGGGAVLLTDAFTYPANVATANWTAAPADWASWRWQSEISHAVNAALTFVGFCTLAASVLVARA